MPELVLGPLLRYVGEDCAVIWIETDAACEVGALGATAPTFCVEGHHYALVKAHDLECGKVHEYAVTLDGEHAWPPPDYEFPPPRFRTYPKAEALQVAFGSCRVAVPHEEPYTLTKDEDERGREIDALRALALRMVDQPPEEHPDLLLLLGDQVYADEVSPRTRDFIRARRDVEEPPGEIALDYEEYTQLYRESWSEPVIRWLLSTVPSAMIFDDHDVHDDWNISQAWVREMRATGWWDEHIIGALMSYWVYQHLGNLSPDEQDEDELFARVRELEDAGPLLRRFAIQADRTTDSTRWSYHRDIGGSRLLVIDSRAGRTLEPGDRSMLDDDEWRWLEDHATGGFDHLLIASSLPWLLAPGMHHFEAWSEAVCDGAWGSAAAALGERVRQGVDLEHWAAFRESFERLADIQRSVGAGERGEPPASIVTLSGDVHHAYLSEVGFRAGSNVRSNVWQAVCSPLRNPLNSNEKRVIRVGASRFGHALGRALARAAGVPDPPVRWRSIGDGPWFDNQIALLDMRRRELTLTLEVARPDGTDRGSLEHSFEWRLA